MAELKSVYIDRTGDWCRSENDTGKFYLKEEVDELVSKLKEQISKERSAKVDYHISANDLSDGLAKAYAENRRLKRALYNACARWAMAESYSVLHDAPTANRWVKMLNKMKNKVEVYK